MTAVLIALSGCGGDGIEPATNDLLELTAAISIDGDIAAVQLEVRDCMADRGHDYIPVLLEPGPPNLGDLTRRGAVVLGVDSAFFEAYGYGVTETIQAVLRRSEADQNRAVVAQMTPSNQAAYTTDLGSCLVRAQEAHGLNELASVAADIAALTEDLDRSILSHPDVVSRVPLWASCMSEAGYPYRDLAEPFRTLSETAERRTSIAAESHSHDGEAGHRHDSELATDHTHRGDAVVLDGLISDLQAEELELAMVDYACRVEADLVDTLAAIREEEEADFIKDHQRELDRLTSLAN